MSLGAGLRVMVALQNQGFNKQIPCLKHSWRTMQKIAAFHLKQCLFCSHYKLFRPGWDLHFLNSFPAEQLLSCLWWECLCDMGHTRCFMNLQPSQGYSLATRTLYEQQPMGKDTKLILASSKSGEISHASVVQQVKRRVLICMLDSKS